jgi:hypothetical protein
VNTMAAVFCVDCGQKLTGQYCGKCGRDYGATAAAQRASSPLATATVQHVGSSAMAGAQQDVSSLTAGAQRAVSPATAGAQRAVSPTSRPTATAVYALPVMNAVCYTVLTVWHACEEKREPLWCRHMLAARCEALVLGSQAGPAKRHAAVTVFAACRWAHSDVTLHLCSLKRECISPLRKCRQALSLLAYTPRQQAILQMS